MNNADLWDKITQHIRSQPFLFIGKEQTSMAVLWETSVRSAHTKKDVFCTNNGSNIQMKPADGSINFAHFWHFQADLRITYSSPLNTVVNVVAVQFKIFFFTTQTSKGPASTPQYYFLNSQYCCAAKWFSPLPLLLVPVLITSSITCCPPASCGETYKFHHKTPCCVVSIKCLRALPATVHGHVLQQYY